MNLFLTQICNGDNQKRAKHCSHEGVNGFTLVEWMVTIAVSAILLTITVPALSNVMVSSRLTSFANTFLAHLYLARGEAIKRNGRAALCKSATGVSCASEGDWQQGWIVFQDENDNALRDISEVVLLQQSALPNGYFLNGNATVQNYISYSPTGSTKLSGGAFQAGTLTLCEQSSQQGRKIIISSTGRARIVKATMIACP